MLVPCFSSDGATVVSRTHLLQQQRRINSTAKMAAMTGGFGSLPRSLKDKQRQAVLKLLNFNSDDAGKRTAANFDGVGMRR